MHSDFLAHTILHLLAYNNHNKQIPKMGLFQGYNYITVPDGTVFIVQFTQVDNPAPIYFSLYKMIFKIYTFVYLQYVLLKFNFIWLM